MFLDSNRFWVFDSLSLFSLILYPLSCLAIYKWWWGFRLDSGWAFTHLLLPSLWLCKSLSSLRLSSSTIIVLIITHEIKVLFLSTIVCCRPRLKKGFQKLYFFFPFLVFRFDNMIYKFLLIEFHVHIKILLKGIETCIVENLKLL